jgi:hypothetical protein
VCPSRYYAGRRTPFSKFRKVLKLPFAFHTHESSYRVPVIHRAVSNGVSWLVKLLAENVRYLGDEPALDSFGRTPVEVAIDTLSLKLVSTTNQLELTTAHVSLIHRVSLCEPWGFVDSKMQQDIVRLLSEKNAYPTPVERSHKKVRHHNCVKTYSPWYSGKCQCALQNYTPLEIACAKSDVELARTLVENGHGSEMGFALELAIIGGNLKLISMLSCSIGHLSDIQACRVIMAACRSPRIATAIFDSMAPILKRLVSLSNNLKDSSSIVWREDTLHASISSRESAQCPLAVLLSKKDRAVIGETGTSISDVETAALSLIHAGISLGEVQDVDGSITHVACEALFWAIENNYWHAAETLLSKTHDLVWKCALSSNSCSAQRRCRHYIQRDPFARKRHIYDTRMYGDTQVSLIRYILFVFLRQSTTFVAKRIHLHNKVSDGTHTA